MSPVSFPCCRSSPVTTTVYNSSRTQVLCGQLLCVWTLHTCVCAVCTMIRVRVWNPTFQLFVSFALLAAAAAVSCRLYHTVPQALKLSTLWHTRYNSSGTASLWACVGIAYACVLCMLRYVCVCVGVCRSVHLCAWCWNPTFISAFSFLFAPAAPVSCLHHTVPQALKLEWQPRYNSSRTAKIVWTTSMHMTLHIYI